MKHFDIHQLQPKHCLIESEMPKHDGCDLMNSMITIDVAAKDPRDDSNVIDRLFSGRFRRFLKIFQLHRLSES